MEITKNCSYCKKEKSLEYFQLGNGKLGRRSQCKECCKLLYDTPERLKRNRERRNEKRKEDSNYRKRENELVKLNNRSNPIKYLIRTAKNRAKYRNVEFSITEKDLSLPDKCPLLGIVLKVNADKSGYNSYSIDRIDNTKGYIAGNVWIISNRANLLKNNASLKELELLVKNLKKKNKVRD